MRASLFVCLSSLSLAASPAFAEGSPEGHAEAAATTTSTSASPAEHHEAAHGSAEESWDLGAGFGVGFLDFG
jgi:hypothetical protein